MGVSRERKLQRRDARGDERRARRRKAAISRSCAISRGASGHPRSAARKRPPYAARPGWRRRDRACRATAARASRHKAASCVRSRRGASRAERAVAAPVRARPTRGRQFVELLDERMADIDATRPAEPLDGRPARRATARARNRHRRASRSRGPDATPRPSGSHNRRSGFRKRATHLARDAMREIRRVDDDETIGRGRDDGARRLVDARDESWQTREHRQQTHHGDVGRSGKARRGLRAPSPRRRRPRIRVGARSRAARASARRPARRRRLRPRRERCAAAHAASPRARGAQSGRGDGARRKSTIRATSASSAKAARDLFHPFAQARARRRSRKARR